jgi:DnaJ-class molecular chaperone
MNYQINFSYYFDTEQLRQGGKAGAVKACNRCRGSGKVFITRQIGPGMILAYFKCNKRFM